MLIEFYIIMISHLIAKCIYNQFICLSWFWHRHITCLIYSLFTCTVLSGNCKCSCCLLCPAVLPVSRVFISWLTANYNDDDDDDKSSLVDICNYQSSVAAAAGQRLCGRLSVSISDWPTTRSRIKHSQSLRNSLSLTHRSRRDKDMIAYV